MQATLKELKVGDAAKWTVYLRRTPSRRVVWSFYHDGRHVPGIVSTDEFLKHVVASKKAAETPASARRPRRPVISYDDDDDAGEGGSDADEGGSDAPMAKPSQPVFAPPVPKRSRTWTPSNTVVLDALTGVCDEKLDALRKRNSEVEKRLSEAATKQHSFHLLNKPSWKEANEVEVLFLKGEAERHMAEAGHHRAEAERQKADNMRAVADAEQRYKEEVLACLKTKADAVEARHSASWAKLRQAEEELRQRVKRRKTERKQREIRETEAIVDSFKELIQSHLNAEAHDDCIARLGHWKAELGHCRGKLARCKEEVEARELAAPRNAWPRNAEMQ
jgi:flagellar biosynthesis GTPase FlhF